MNPLPCLLSGCDFGFTSFVEIEYHSQLFSCFNPMTSQCHYIYSWILSQYQWLCFHLFCWKEPSPSCCSTLKLRWKLTLCSERETVYWGEKKKWVTIFLCRQSQTLLMMSWSATSRHSSDQMENEMWLAVRRPFNMWAGVPLPSCLTFLCMCFMYVKSALLWCDGLDMLTHLSSGWKWNF